MDLEEPEVAFSFEEAVWTLWTFHFAFFAVKCLTRLTTWMDAHCLLVINSTGFLVTSSLFCIENLSCLVKFWCIIGGSVEVLNEVQSILVH